MYQQECSNLCQGAARVAPIPVGVRVDLPSIVQQGDVPTKLLTLLTTKYIPSSKARIAMRGPLPSSHMGRVIRVPLSTLKRRTKRRGNDALIMASNQKGRIPSRVAFSKGLVFPTDIGTNSDTQCRVQGKGPSALSIVTYKQRCPRHVSSVT